MWVVILAGVGCVSVPPGGEPRRRLVVEEVELHGIAAGAGLAVGDELLRWRRGAAGGELESPFDLDHVRAEEAPRGTVTLEARRGRKTLAFALAEGDWGLAARPRLDGDRERALVEARQAGADERGERLRRLAQLEPRPAVRVWLLVLGAEAAPVETAAGGWDEAVAAASRAPHTSGWVHQRWGEALRAAGRLDEAAAAFTRSLESWSAGSLSAARSLDALGRLASKRGDVAAADEYSRQALEIQERLAPGSLEVAKSLGDLAGVAWRLGDLAAAEDFQRRALAIQQRLAPGSLDLAGSLNNVGVVARARGDLATAEGYYRQALAIQERLAPGSLELAGSLNNLGGVAWSRGDLEAAEGYHRQALELRERLAPSSLEVAESLNNLGGEAMDRGDFESAASHYLRALEIKERLAPGSLAVATSLENLGVLARNTGQLAVAEGYHRQALEIKERIAPGSLAAATTLDNLGALASDGGDLEAAEDWHRRAFAIIDRLAPGSLAVATSHHHLGKLALRRGDLDEAERRLRAGLAIEERLGPGSTRHAVCLHDLASVLLAGSRTTEAVDILRRAVAAIEAQQQRLGGSPERLGQFRALHQTTYHDLVGALVAQGRAAEAFAVLESARARALLAMLAERDIVVAELPEELERERRVVNADYERTAAALGKLAVEGGDEERAKRLAELDAIGRRQEEVRARIRAASPRLAELRYPDPLDLAASQALLEPGAVLLSFDIGKDGGHLFAVGADRCQAFPLALGELALREEVARLRRLVERGGIDPDGDSAQALARSALSLSAALLAPAKEAIAGASRLVIVPDGPLHLLPFALLADPADEQRYLVEGRPLLVVASTTVLGQLRRGREGPRAVSAVGFGDPLYPLEGDRALDPLPYTRGELAALGGLFGESATLWAGADATEERAKALGGELRVVHFAAHGLVDELRPLSSALALSVPARPATEQDNGLLQAWEIFERVRFSADLVTLSACQTALGREVAGEGIVGLTRAFQFAGARSVLATLWSVADSSTAQLMDRFYQGLHGGLAKDEALRQAQLAFIHRSDAERGDELETERDHSHPFFWAAFQLVGDWR